MKLGTQMDKRTQKPAFGLSSAKPVVFWVQARQDTVQGQPK